MGDRISIVVVDDHSLFRAGVIQTLMLDPDLEVIGQGGSGADAVTLVQSEKPDIVLLDISMPGNGVDAAREIALLEHPAKVIMLTVSENDENIMGALEAGAVGYILKGIEATQLIDAVRSVAEGNSFISPNLTLRLLANVKRKATPSLLSTLSEQERRTLKLVSKGMSNREVGQELGILEKTVKFHMTRIMAKIKARNRVEASLIARREWGNGD